MMRAGTMTIDANRWEPFTTIIEFLGVAFTGATLQAQVRQKKDNPGAALVDLTTVTNPNTEGLRLIYAGSATVADHIAAGRLSGVPDGMGAGDTTALSLVGMRINEATMEALPPAKEIGADLTLFWDMQITQGGAKRRWLEGPFNVLAGVTH
ncbi:hypothetical protein [Allosphingosinicella indica]|uniref:Uncharacterized protein n=1 Tax=Allosphingosinicella indica TaxID=941907 RepID=A0A1X7GIW1_9SPHN|nr:hypothetical protein [Allosphingosinicella indica]SMF70495.1 hypothetical protein SAMN06295910_1884 [Allosphingosinicella indica]